MLKKDGRWIVGSSWTSWIRSRASSEHPPQTGWLVRSGVKTLEEEKEFILDSTLRLRFGTIECHAITVSSSGPIFQKFGKSYLGKFYRIEYGYKAGRPIFQNMYGKCLTMINIFGRVHYWTVHDSIPVEEDNELLYKNMPAPVQCFRLNLRRNICPSLARGSDKFFLYKIFGMAETKIAADSTLSVTCDWHSKELYR